MFVCTCTTDPLICHHEEFSCTEELFCPSLSTPVNSKSVICREMFTGIKYLVRYQYYIREKVENNGEEIKSNMK